MALLRHIHLNAHPSSGASNILPRYAEAVLLQHHIQRLFLDYKASPTTSSPPPPTLLTFTPSPTYTFGRRQTSSLSLEEINHLKRPLLIAPFRSLLSSLESPLPTLAENPKRNEHIPALYTSRRGGLQTYHGPGQLVCWPILDLRSGHLKPQDARYSPLSVRNWAHLLEDVTISILRKESQIEGFTDCANPGVWTVGHARESLVAGKCTDGTAAPEGMRKIAALGIHLRRHVTGLGIGLNLTRPLRPSFPSKAPIVDPQAAGTQEAEKQDGLIVPRFGGAEPQDEYHNPWARFLPCGIGGRGVTSVLAEREQKLLEGTEDAFIEIIANSWAAGLAASLGLNGVERVALEEVIPAAKLGQIESLEWTSGIETGEFGIWVEAKPS